MKTSCLPILDIISEVIVISETKNQKNMTMFVLKID